VSRRVGVNNNNDGGFGLAWFGLLVDWRGSFVVELDWIGWLAGGE